VLASPEAAPPMVCVADVAVDTVDVTEEASGAVEDAVWLVAVVLAADPDPVTAEVAD
jgi:hypothetical protein